jgi:hypothetical protein
MALVARAWPRRLRRRPEDEVEVSRSGRTNRKTLWGNWQQQFLP